MTVTCPSGHASATTDYCDQCGAPITAAASAPPKPVAAPAPPKPAAASPQPKPGAAQAALDALDEEFDTSPAAQREPCPVCAAPRSGDDRYCEGCGYDFSAPPPAVAEWDAIATADRHQFDRQSSAGIEFPTDYPVRTFALSQSEIHIGRSHPGESGPEIDLAERPADPGISRHHAVLERQQDGSYTLRDLGSTNGTALNDGSTRVGTEVGVPLDDGDRIHLGAWTTITLRKR